MIEMRLCWWGNDEVREALLFAAFEFLECKNKNKNNNNNNELDPKSVKVFEYKHNFFP
jgi:hypothetical protein